MSALLKATYNKRFNDVFDLNLQEHIWLRRLDRRAKAEMIRMAPASPD